MDRWALVAEALASNAVAIFIWGFATVLCLGIDFGTSGARATVMDAAGGVVAAARVSFEGEDVARPQRWCEALWHLLAAIAADVRSRITRIAVNGTSATVLLCDAAGQPLTPALLYNDASARPVLADLAGLAPVASPVQSATSSLAKALWWQQTLPRAIRQQVHRLAHQADWLAAQLHGRSPISDYHNALKLGYDVQTLAYPPWLLALPVAPWLPPVVLPGAPVAPIAPLVSETYGLPPTCQICAGTTDSIAAFLASGAQHAGEAVTSLGSTLVLKLLSRQPIYQADLGVYSHRLGDLWLVGGASNTGGAVLKRFFSSAELAALSQQIDVSAPCPSDYYPLNEPGERFPINDPDYPPRLTPRPSEDAVFLHGLLSAIARIEADGYRVLERLGAPTVQHVYTAGGGAQNSIWQTLRAQQLQVPVCKASQTEAAYGTATLACVGLSPFTSKTQTGRAT